MPNRKSAGGFHVGDIVEYDGQRMRIVGFPTDKLVFMTALLFTVGKPASVKTNVGDKKIHVVLTTKEG